MGSTPLLNPARNQERTSERFFQWSLYLLLVTGFTALAGSGKLDFPSLAVATPALALRGYHLLRGKTVKISERWTNYLTIAYFAFYILDYLYISRGFVAATVHMVLFSMVVKIFSVQRDRDLLYLAVLSFLMVLATAVLTVDTLFLLTFFVFLLMAFATFISMEMRRSERELRATAPPAREARRFNRSLGMMAVALGTLTMACGAVIFFVLPRMNSGGYMRSLGADSQLATGFSQDVRLGGIGEIQQSSAVVMHVQVRAGTLPADVKWRGVALSHFDGRRWWNTPERPEVYLFPFVVGNASAYSSSSSVPHAATLEYQVVMEPLGLNIFFLAPVPVELTGNYHLVGVSPDGSISLLPRGGGALNVTQAESVGVYLAESDTRDPEPLIANSTSHAYPAHIALTYLQLPRLDPRIPALARQITAPAKTTYEKARAVERYLQQSYGYTLELPAVAVTDPLANFLFERRKGHCEYFASSMAVMMRSLGVPARVVNGFRGGEYNRVTGSYIVREKDAHSWVEVYFPEYGWVTFDPTPAAPLAASEGNWATLALYMDAAREVWREWVINYDFSHQMQLSSEVNSAGESMQFRIRRWLFHSYRTLLRETRKLQVQTGNLSTREILLGISAVLVLTGLILAPRAWRSAQRLKLARSPRQAPRSAASYWYLRLLKWLARRGMHKEETQTAAEFASSIKDGIVREDVQAFTAHYERARFADSAEDAQKLPELYEQLAARK